MSALALTCGAGCGWPGSGPELNLLLVSIDTLRADHLGTYGYPRATSPRIDRFAKDAVVFQNAFTTMPKTGPAMTSLFTGRYPQDHGVTENPAAIPDEDVLLAEILPASMRKAAFVANPTLARERGYGAGFDEFVSTQFGSAHLTDRALAWLERHHEERFFLWIHYLDPHGPYQPPEPLRDRFVGDRWYDPSVRVALDYEPTPGLNENYVLGAVPRYQQLGHHDRVDYYIAQYDAEILYVDTQLGRILDYLEESGLLERTLVVLVADHGESLGEQDYYFEHGMLLNEGSIRVPLLVRLPGVRPRVVTDLVQLIDVVPTLLPLLGVSRDLDAAGRDLADLLTGREGAQGREWVYACTPYPTEYPTFYETVRTADQKFVREAGGGLAFYDLAADPAERLDRIAELSAPRRKTFLDLMIRFGRRGISRRRFPHLPASVRQRIQALGYIE